MHKLTPKSLSELCEQYGFETADTDLEDLSARVSDILVGVDNVLDVSANIESFSKTKLDRKWEIGSDKYNSIITTCDIKTGKEKSKLKGMSIGIKDNIPVAGVPLTCGSKILKDFIPDFDATVVVRLLKSGANITAKTNLDEFASGGPWGLSSAYRGTILNPIDIRHAAGGSSGGSAAAVAAGLVDGALGTDTGGSIRIPSAFCGVVGLKPTNGLVPLSGIVETSRTLDTVGPIANNVYDVARILDVIAGPDQGDLTSIHNRSNYGSNYSGYAENLSQAINISKVKFGIIEQSINQNTEKNVKLAFNTTINNLRDLGATIERINLKYFDLARDVKNVIRYFEGLDYFVEKGLLVRSNEAREGSLQSVISERFSRQNQKLSKTYKSKMLAGAYLLNNEYGVHYRHAKLARNIIRKEFDNILNSFDCLITPTIPGTAPLIDSLDESYGKSMMESSSLGYDFARNLRCANVTGLPSITVPVYADSKLPAGIQIIGSRYGESDLLNIAYQIESFS